MTDLSVEDAKLVTLARGARGRITAEQGAALRDDMGRTYSAATVHTHSLQLSALEVAVAQAISAGATGIEAAVVVGAGHENLDALRDLGGSGITVRFCDAAGNVDHVATT